MDTYIDGFIIPVPDDKRAEYEALAKISSEVFVDHGALETYESWSDDVKEGKVTDFFRSVNAREGEVLVYAVMIWPSKEVRDKAMQTAMQDERFKNFNPGEVFDGSRMIFGGFKTFLHRKAN